MHNIRAQQTRLPALAALLVAGSTLGSGCSVVRIVTAVRQAQQQGQPAWQRPRPAYVRSPAARQYIAGLKPLASGPGLVVCEPVAAGVDATTSALGAGCARWLHLTVAGHGEFGKTPLWGAVDDARREMAKFNLQFTPTDAARLARKLGVTHIATGEIKGNAARCTLTYRLWQMPAQKPIGAPLTVTGSATQVVAGLPEIGRKLAVQLGVAAPRVPDAVGATASEMVILGQAAWKARRQPKAVAPQLPLLARRLPLAGILYQRSGKVPTDQVWKPVVQSLLTAAPDNALVIGDIGWTGARMLAPHSAVVARALKRFPNNYLLATAEMCRHRANLNRAGERTAAERAVRCAPANPTAWESLADAIANEAQDIRQSRFSTDLTPAEWATLSSLYAEAYEAAQRAVALDAGDANAWAELCVAATFVSDPATADTALWKALAIEPTNREAIRWGLQLYQPKWFGDRTKLMKLVNMVTADADLFSELYEPAIGALKYSNMGSKAQELTAKAVSDFQAAATANPKDAAAQGRLGNLFWHERRYDEAIPHLRTAAQLGSTDAEAHYHLGWILHYQKRTYQEAEQMYRKAIALNPQYDEAINALGDITYYVHRDAKAAEKLYRRAIALEGDGLYNAELARLLADQGRRAEAMAEAQKAIALGYRDRSNPIWGQLGINP